MLVLQKQHMEWIKLTSGQYCSFKWMFMIKQMDVKKMAFPRAFYHHKNVIHVTALTKRSYALLFIKQNSYLSSQNFKITLPPNWNNILHMRKEYTSCKTTLTSIMMWINRDKTPKHRQMQFILMNEIYSKKLRHRSWALSFWYKKYVDEDEYGASAVWFWHGKTKLLTENPSLCHLSKINLNLASISQTFLHADPFWLW